MEKKVWIFFKDVIVDWSIIFACFNCIAQSEHILIQTFCVILIGIEQYRLGILLHDGMHQTIFATKRNNFLAANLVIGWWVFSDVKGFYRFHSKHHAHNGSEKDIELTEGKGSPVWKALGRWDLPVTPLKIITWFFIDIITGPILALGFILGLKVEMKNRRPVKFHWKELLGSFFLLAPVALVLYFTNTLWVLGIWFLAFSIVFMALFNLRIYTEHLGCAAGETVAMADPKKWYEWLYEVTVGAHNIRIHEEHHDFPKTPYMMLPIIRKERLLKGLQPITLKEIFFLLKTSPKIRSGEVLSPGDKRSLIYRATFLRQDVFPSESLSSLSQVEKT